MNQNVITIKPNETIFEAANQMLDQKVSGLSVIDETGKLLGMITESDIFRMVVRMGVAETP